MKEWGIPFHVIENEWTDWQYFMFLDRMNERLEEQAKAMERNKAKKARGF